MDKLGEIAKYTAKQRVHPQIMSRAIWNSFEWTRNKHEAKKGPVETQNTVASTERSESNVKKVAIDKKIKHNVIFYGIPGCGKSHYVKELLKEEKGCAYDNIFRVTFYPDYSYSDFVGQIIPMVDKNDDSRIHFSFKPGIFTLALEKAYQYQESNDNTNVYLVIEELNRGNASAIFGDIFQLLDRDKDGQSEYPIKNQDIQEYLQEKKLNRDSTTIILPNIFYILATMNTSDQNVVPLDTAFKRRWSMRYVENGKNECNNKIIPLMQHNKNDIKWNDFVSAINKLITNSNNTLNSEDKQIGYFFVNEDDLVSDNTHPSEHNEEAIEFSSKVFQYLWLDAFSLERESVFKQNTLEDILTLFKNGKVFEASEIFKDFFNYYQA